MSEWKSIETAPKDGTEIDIWVRCNDNLHSSHRQPNAFWCDYDLNDPYNIYGAVGWWMPLYEKFVHDYDEWTVTHWMPLPHPPNEQ